MPIHDWTRVAAGIFHDFHHSWIATLSRSLNAGLMPPEYYSLIAPASTAAESWGSAPDDETELDFYLHLLILDILPPGRLDPHGMHGAIWEELDAGVFDPAADKPLMLAAYESAKNIRAYVEPVAVGDSLADMPLFLQPEVYIAVPLEQTYAAAFAAVPRRWRRVLEGP